MIRIVRPIDPPPLVIGPEDAGRALSLNEYRRARFQNDQGVVYEIIDGFITVSPIARPLHDFWVWVLLEALTRYSTRHRSYLAHVSGSAEVVVAKRSSPTRPIPDIALFRRFPLSKDVEWDDLTPFIVIEVISDRRAKKDTVRNRHLYHLVPGIREYWIIDPRGHELEPTMTILRRRRAGADWEETELSFGDTYKTDMLPGFSLNLKRLSSR